jgi:hypothetical protein
VPSKFIWINLVVRQLFQKSFQIIYHIILPVLIRLHTDDAEIYNIFNRSILTQFTVALNKCMLVVVVVVDNFSSFCIPLIPPASTVVSRLSILSLDTYRNIYGFSVELDTNPVIDGSIFFTLLIHPAVHQFFKNSYIRHCAVPIGSSDIRIDVSPVIS